MTKILTTSMIMSACLYNDKNIDHKHDIVSVFILWWKYQPQAWYCKCVYPMIKISTTSMILSACLSYDKNIDHQHDIVNVFILWQKCCKNPWKKQSKFWKYISKTFCVQPSAFQYRRKMASAFVKLTISVPNVVTVSQRSRKNMSVLYSFFVVALLLMVNEDFK
jgi:hypothetical protein